MEWPPPPSVAGDILVWAAEAKNAMRRNGVRFMPAADSLALLDELGAIVTGRDDTPTAIPRAVPRVPGRTASGSECDVATVAGRWKVTPRRVRALAEAGRFPGSWQEPGTGLWHLDADAVEGEESRRAHSAD
jgi:hypothetical protein